MTDEVALSPSAPAPTPPLETNAATEEASPSPSALPSPPTLDAVRAFSRSSGLCTDAERFWNHYQSNGWRAGNHPVLDWRAKLREWDARDRLERADSASPTPPDNPASASSPSDPASPTSRAAPSLAMAYAQRTYRDSDFAEGFFVDPRKQFPPGA